MRVRWLGFLRRLSFRLWVNPAGNVEDRGPRVGARVGKGIRQRQAGGQGDVPRDSDHPPDDGPVEPAHDIEGSCAFVGYGTIPEKMWRELLFIGARLKKSKHVAKDLAALREIVMMITRVAVAGSARPLN
jgi:hypothetical protein